MLLWLIFLFITIPLVELYVLIQIGQVVGALPTLGLVILTGVLGGLLARMQGLRVWRRVQNELAAGRIPTGALGDAFAVFAGGLLLLTPGLLTDLLGLSLLFPPTRGLIKKAVANHFRNRFNEVRYERYDDTIEIQPQRHDHER